MSKKERLIMAFSIVAGFTCAQYLIKIFIRIQNPTVIPTWLVAFVLLFLVGYPIFMAIDGLLKWIFQKNDK